LRKTKLRHFSWRNLRTVRKLELSIIWFKYSAWRHNSNLVVSETLLKLFWNSPETIMKLVRNQRDSINLSVLGQLRCQNIISNINLKLEIVLVKFKRIFIMSTMPTALITWLSLTCRSENSKCKNKKTMYYYRQSIYLLKAHYFATHLLPISY